MKLEKHLDLLGLKVKDRVTGFTGIVSTISFDLYGCIQAIVTPRSSENGKQEDSRYYDIARLEVLDSQPVMEQPKFKENYALQTGKKGPAEKPTYKG